MNISFPRLAIRGRPSFSGRRNGLYLSLAAILTGLAFSPRPAVAAPGDSVFSGLKAHTINIVFDSPWNVIEPILKDNKEQEIYIPASLEINCLPPDTSGCIRMDSVGVRHKGNSTFSKTRQKNPWRISFDEYGIDQRWDGIKGLVLNNGWNDNSFVRERIHHEVAYRAGLPVSRTNYAWLYINGERYSFYHMLELVDKRFLSSRFGENEGDRFKATDLLGGNRPSNFTRRSPYTPSAYYGYYEANSDDTVRAWNRMVKFIDTLNLVPDARIAEVLPRIVNVNELYNGLALDALLGNSDNYIGSAQNFNVYFPADGGPMRWIPWDVSLTLGSSTSALVRTNVSSRPLNNRFTGDATLRADYLRAAWFTHQAYIAGTQLHELVDTLKAFTQPHLKVDPNPVSSSSRPLTESERPGKDSDFESLKSRITTRITWIDGQFSTNGINAENAIRTGDIVINELAPASGWVELYNARDYAIDLSGHALTHDSAQTSKWTFPLRSFVKPKGHIVVRMQGGQLGNAGPASFALSTSGGSLRLVRASGSIVDSVTYPARSGDSTIARTTDGSGAFGTAFPTPGSANVATTGSIAPLAVVINEFMADNDTIIAPTGLKSDWVELYNTTNAAIDLSGMHLSDNATNPTKWTFPANTTVPANGYLVVWAYDTTVAGTLHARWALSKDGEHIVLSNANQTIVDSVTFGPQAKSRTMARIPNGTGPFQSGCPATLGTPNACPVTSLAGSRSNMASSLLELRPGQAHIRLATAEHVRLSLHDTRGREVALLFAGRLPAGDHPVAITANRLPTGTYFIRLQAGPHRVTRQTVILR